MVTQSYKLDVIPGGVPVVVHCHQNDILARAFELDLYSRNGDLVIPVSASAYIEGYKPDGNAFSYAASLDEGKVAIDLHEQMTVLPGDVRCQCKVVDGVKVLISANFTLRVERDYTAGVDMSETEVPGLVQQAQAAAAAAEEAAANIDEEWFVNGAKGTTVDTYATTSKLTAGAINELKGRADTNASGISENSSIIATNTANISINKSNIQTNASEIAKIKSQISPNPTDMNNTNLFGYTALLHASEVVNLPTAGANHYYKVICMKGYQIASRYNEAGDSNAFQRMYVNGVWAPWSIVADAGTTNIGEFGLTKCTGSAMSLRRFGGNVVFQATLNTTADIAAGGSGEGFVIFPEGFRPLAGFGFVGQVGQGVRAFYIAPSGKMQVAGTAIIPSGTVVRISGSFFGGN